MKEARKFTIDTGDGNKLTWEFRRPSQKVLNKAELIYRAKFSEALRDGLILNAEAMKLVKERGLWDSAQEEEEKALRDEMVVLEKKLEDQGLSNKQGRAICEKLGELRIKLRDHGSIVSSIMENTCESVGNDERNQYLTAACTYTEDGQKVYKDVEDFKSKLAEPGAIEAYREAIIASLEIVAGRELPSDLTEEYAENKWLTTRGTEDEPKEKKTRKKRSTKKRSTAKTE